MTGINSKKWVSYILLVDVLGCWFCCWSARRRRLIIATLSSTQLSRHVIRRQQSDRIRWLARRGSSSTRRIMISPTTVATSLVQIRPRVIARPNKFPADLILPRSWRDTTTSRQTSTKSTRRRGIWLIRKEMNMPPSTIGQDWLAIDLHRLPLFRCLPISIRTFWTPGNSNNISMTSSRSSSQKNGRPANL